MITTLKQYKQLVNTVRHKPHYFTTIEFGSIELVLGYYKTSDDNLNIVAVFYQNIMLPMEIISDETLSKLTVELENDVKGI